MTRPLYSPPRPAPAFTRNRWISPRQTEMLESLWNARLRREARRPRPERSREERFRHIAETVGRKVENASELSWREANRVIRRLLDEVRSNGLLPAPADPSSAPADSKPLAAPCRRAPMRPPKNAASPARSGRSKSISRGHPACPELVPSAVEGRSQGEEHSEEGPALLRRGNVRRSLKSSQKGGRRRHD